MQLHLSVVGLRAIVIGSVLLGCLPSGGSASAVRAMQADCRPHESARDCYRRALTYTDSIEAARARGDTVAIARARSSIVRAMADACGRGFPEACIFHARLLFIEHAHASSSSEGDPGGQLERNAHLTEAAGLFESRCLAEPPNAEACHGLGDAFEKGFGRRLALDSALHYFERGCDGGNPSACSRAAALMRDMPGISSATVDSLEIALTDRACRAGSMNGCIQLGYFRDRLATRPDQKLPAGALDHKAPLELFESACSAGMPVGCSSLGWRYEQETLSGDERAGERAVHYYRLGCNGVLPPGLHRSGERPPLAHGYACMALGIFFKAGRFVPQNEDSARYYTERACHELVYSDACVRLGRFFGDTTSARNLRMFKVACMEGNSSACNSAGVTLFTVWKDTAEAEHHYLRGCSLGDSYACSNLGGLNSGRKTPEARRAAYKYNRRSCELRGTYGCRNLGWLLRDDGHDELARFYFEDSCRVGLPEGIASGCWEAMRWHAQRKNEEETARYRADACRADALYCKRKT